MKKKIFLTSACALLAVSGVWALDAPNPKNGTIQYTIVSTKENYEEVVTDKFTSGNTTTGTTYQVTWDRTTVIRNYPEYTVSITSLGGSSMPVIGSFTNNIKEGDQKYEGATSASYSFTKAKAEYKNVGDALVEKGTILDFATASENYEVYGANNSQLTSSSAEHYFYETTNDDDEDVIIRIGTFKLAGYHYSTTHQEYTYIPKVIEANGVFNNCTSVTIGTGVEEIQNGAFSGASSLSTFIVNNDNFDVDSKNGFLYTKKHDVLIAVPAGLSGTYTLDSKCVEVYSKALDNCTGVTLMTSSESVANNTTLTGGKNNQIVYTNADLTCDANNVYSGFVYGNNLNKAIGTMVAGNSYDFRSTTVMEDINVDALVNKLPANVILFFAEGATISGTNIVKGEVCKSLVLQDGTAPYNNLMGRINAYQITYRRTVNDTKWATVCVPFSWSLAANKSVWAGSLNGYEDNTITFIREPNPAAGVPLLMCNNSGSNLTEITSSGWVEMSSTINNGSKNGVGFNGIYDRFEVTTENNVFMYNANGSLNKAKNGNYCNPFRAYITYGGSASAPKIRFVDEFENEVDLGNTTGLVEMLNEEAESNIYNVKGQKVNNMTAPGVYVKNGKKVIVK